MSASEHAHYADDCGAYLLGALGEHERQAFEAHLAVCAECRQQVDLLRPAANALPRSVTPLSPPPGLKRTLMEVVEQEVAERQPAPARRPLRERLAGLLPSFAGARPALAWTSAAFLLAVGIAGGIGIGQLVSGDDGGGKTLSASVDSSRAPSASASLVVPGGDREGAILRVHGLPPLGPSRVYQVWLQRGHEVIPEPTFLPGKNGSGAGAVPDSLKGADAVMVTRERRGGAPVPTETPIIRVKL
jgi:anti-sigma-K factor RskA